MKNEKNDNYSFEKIVFGKEMESLWECFGKDAIPIKNTYLQLRKECQDQDTDDGVFSISTLYFCLDQEKQFHKVDAYIKILVEMGLVEKVGEIIWDNMEGWMHDNYVADYEYFSLYKLVELTGEVIEEACKRAKDIFCVKYPFQGDQLVVNK